VKHFFKYYAIYGHKMAVLTPYYHAAVLFFVMYHWHKICVASPNTAPLLQSYSAEDNIYDLRQFLYNSRWPYQFRRINEFVQEMDKDGKWETSANEKLREHKDTQGNGVGVVAVGSANPRAQF
jgi:NAD+ synthase (glutamine-hydrolysing)